MCQLRRVSHNVELIKAPTVPLACMNSCILHQSLLQFLALASIP